LNYLYYGIFGVGILSLALILSKGAKGVEDDNRNDVIPENDYENNGYYMSNGNLYIKKKNLAEIIEDIYDDYSDRYIDFDKELIMAICWQESSFHVNAEGDNGNSKGLMQISETAFDQVKKVYYSDTYGIRYSDIKDVRTNLKIGILYLHWIYNTGWVDYQDWAKLYAIYNGGYDYPDISYTRGLEVKQKYGILKRGGY